MIELAAKALLVAALALQGSEQVRFDFRFPGSLPPEYHMSVSPEGDATFQEPASEEQEGYRSEFKVSPQKASWVFETAHALDGFSGNYEYRKHKVAETGEKRLTLVGAGGRETGTTYHYSENAQIQQLTEWLQSVATTQEFARRAKLHRRFDKLALDADVKQFLDEVKAGRAAEVQSIRPLLEQLAEDPAVLNSARQRIKALLQ